MTSHVIAVTMTTTAATDSRRRMRNFASEPPMPGVQVSGRRNPHGPRRVGYRRAVRRVLPLVVLAALAGAGASALAQGGGDKATNAYTLQEPSLGDDPVLHFTLTLPACDPGRSVTVRVTPP